jgi:hypothetical protein
MDKLAAHREVGSYKGRGLYRIGAEPTVPGRSAEGGVARSRHHRGRRPPVWTPGDTLVSDLRLPRSLHARARGGRTTTSS